MKIQLDGPILVKQSHAPRSCPTCFSICQETVSNNSDIGGMGKWYCPPHCKHRDLVDLVVSAVCQGFTA